MSGGPTQAEVSVAVAAAPEGSPRSAGPLRRWLAFARLGLTGQVLTLAAMLVPIVLREAEQVFVLVFASAVTVLLTNAALLAFPFLYPVIRGPRMARTATLLSTLALLVVSAAVVPLTVLEPVLDLPRGTFSAAALLTVALGLYDLVVTRLVRVDDRTGIGLARLYYGAIVLPTAVLACLVEWGPLTLTLGSVLAYGGAAALLAVRRQHWGPRLPRAGRATRRRLRRAYLSRCLHPTIASLAGGWTVFLPGLALPGLGAAAEPWAVISRICGGFATVLITIVAPPMEARLSRAIRTRDRHAFSVERRGAVLIGLGSSAVAVLTGIGLAVYATDRSVTGEWFLPLAVAAALFWVPLLAASTINRLPNFLGRDVPRLYWDAARAVLVTVAFIGTDGVVRLVLIGAVLTVSGVVLLPMSRWRSPAGQ